MILILLAVLLLGNSIFEMIRNGINAWNLLFGSYFILWLLMLLDFSIPYAYSFNNIILLILFIILIIKKEYYLLIPLVILRFSQVLQLPGKFIVLIISAAVFVGLVGFLLLKGKIKGNYSILILSAGAYLLEFLGEYLL